MTGGQHPYWATHLKTIVVAVILFPACLVLSRAAPSRPTIEWQHVHPYPSGSWFQAIAWGDPGFVAVGLNGEILFSEDTRTWEEGEFAAERPNWLSGVCYSEGKYLAVGSRYVFSSTNGHDWKTCYTDTNTSFRACAGGEGKLVVAGLGKLLISTNGEVWQERVAPSSFSDIVYGNGLWVAVDDGYKTYTSTDLQNWTSNYVGDSWLGPFISRISFGNGQFVASGSSRMSNGAVLYSTNAVNWESAPLNTVDIGGEAKDSLYSNGQFLSLHSGGLLISSNGVTWNKFILENQRNLTGIACSPTGSFVVVGSSGTMLTSTNARDWRLISSPGREEIQSLAYGKGRFVAVGGSPHYVGGGAGSATALTSTDGITWRATLTNLIDQLSGVAYGNQLWVACGDDGQIFVSPDAIRWVNHSLPPTTHDLNNLVYGNGRFVAFSRFRDLVYYSVNGMRWRSQTVPRASQVNKVKFLNNTFFGLGENGLVLSSRDGVNWKSSYVPNSPRLYTIAFGPNGYVVGGESVIATSRNGKTWNIHSSPYLFYDIQYSNGWFWAVAGGNGFLISRNGLDWQPLDDPLAGHELWVMAAGGDTIVVGGYLDLFRGSGFQFSPMRNR